MTTRESRWTDQDRAEAIALTVYRGSICPGGCGQPVGESTSHWQEGPEYDATGTTCRACAVLDAAQRAEHDRNPNGTAQLWHVTRMQRSE